MEEVARGLGALAMALLHMSPWGWCPYLLWGCPASAADAWNQPLGELSVSCWPLSVPSGAINVLSYPLPR